VPFYKTLQANFPNTQPKVHPEARRSNKITDRLKNSSLRPERQVTSRV